MMDRVAERPYVVLSAAISLDGYLDDAGPRRLILSGPADLERVDAERSRADAILVGANTVRRDDPRLLVRDPRLRRPGRPVKVCLTASGDLSPTARFFTDGDVDKIVYCPPGVAVRLSERLPAATVVPCDPVSFDHVLADLAGRGVRRLLVEGGGSVHTQLLAAGLADELQLAVAPLLVGDDRAPRFLGADARLAATRLRLVETRRLDDVVLLRYRI
jgi:5-amino-6-(5-phosphoribosylamino)uracil reductase